MEFCRKNRSPDAHCSGADATMLCRLEAYRADINTPQKVTEAAIPILLEKGRALAEVDPVRFEATARSLMNAARHMHPYDANRFVRQLITPETFDFQLRFEELRAPSNVTLSGVCGVHVNSKGRLEELRESEMASISKRFDSGWDPEDPDSYRVCFASGEIDALAQFLVGHALLRRPVEGVKPRWMRDDKNGWTMNLAEWWALEPTQQRFAEKFAVAILGGRDLPASDDYLDILSPVRNIPHTVDFLAVTEPTKVRVELMPHTVLLPEQVDQLRRESSRFFAGALRQESRMEVNTFPDQHVVTAHAELVMKYRLLKVYESLTSLPDRSKLLGSDAESAP